MAILNHPRLGYRSKTERRRPTENLIGIALNPNEPILKRLALGKGYYVVLPPFHQGEVQDKALAELQELVSGKSAKD